MTQKAKKVKVKTKPAKTGRKLFDGKDENIVLAKCEEVWALGGSDEEAAFYAKISPSALSRYLQDNPGLAEFREQLRLTPVLKARRTVVARLGDSYDHAMDYLKRKRKLEFAERIENTGAEGKPLIPERKEEINNALDTIL